MSPQTFPAFTRDNSKATPPAESGMRAAVVLRHEMTVVASSVADVVASTGGWLYDRRAAGWQVNVLVADRTGERALRILGADIFDLDGDLEAFGGDPDTGGASLAVAADLYTGDRRVRRLMSSPGSRRAELALWGDTASVPETVCPVVHRLSSAAKAFKTQALMAADLSPDAVPATEALYRCGVTELARGTAQA